PTGIPYQPLLNWKEIRTMSDAGISFGSHTRTHPDLTIIPIDEVEDELIGSKKAIEDAIGQSVDAFAYPYGSFHERIKKLTQAYFTVACSTSLGFVHTGSDFFNLDRLDMYYMRRSGVLKHLFSPSVGYYIRLRRIMRSIRGHTPALGRRR
ncbi:MAG: polysaccharide deacetylase family protein, partial [Deltaproteobacteria bacterium]|nr:polysaccharide deacetylase family protein [Deltaproteobacteria bacterium]